MSRQKLSSPVMCVVVVVLGVLFMLVCSVVTLFMLAGGAEAQDGLSDEELALLADVQTAVSKFYQQQAYSITGQQVSTTGIDMMGQSMAFTTTQNIVGQTILGKDGEVAASSQSLEQITDTSVAGMDMGQTFAYETILVDGKTYIRFTLSEGLGLVSDMYPQDWTEVTDSSENSTAALFANTPAYGASYLPINGFDPSLVDAITEVAGEDIDGQPMRVIELTLNVAAAQTNGFYGTNQVATSEALGAVLGGGAPTSPGVPSTDAVSQEQLDQFLEDMTLVQRVWIGVDDQLPHRVEMVITLNTAMEMAQMGGVSLPFEMETTTTLDFADFNEVFIIEAPDLAS